MLERPSPAGDIAGLVVRSKAVETEAMNGLSRGAAIQIRVWVPLLCRPVQRLGRTDSQRQKLQRDRGPEGYVPACTSVVADSIKGKSQLFDRDNQLEASALHVS